MRVLAVLLVMLAQAGCQSTSPTTFAPFSAKLEPAGGGARYFVLTNASGQLLHNCRFSAYVWNNENNSMDRRYTRQMMGRTEVLPPGSDVRFHELARTIETPITEPITYIELVGQCDEGEFRQYWRYNSSDQLEAVR